MTYLVHTWYISSSVYSLPCPAPFHFPSTLRLVPGPEFAERIKLNEAGNPKFNFLNASNPYHAYYQHKILEIQEGVAQEMQLAASQQGAQKGIPRAAPVAMVIEPEPPKEPPPEWEFTTEPPSISALEL